MTERAIFVHKLPSNTVAPSIAGSGVLDAVLTGTLGTWIGKPTPVLTHQWKRGGVAIIGETGLTYTVTAADQGTTITWTETGTNLHGSASATSNGIAVAAEVGAIYDEDEDMTIITQGSISSPQDAINIAIPAGYTDFRLTLSGIQTSSDGPLGMVFSADGGTTFFNNTDDYDTYDGVCSTFTDIAVTGGSHGGDAAIYLCEFNPLTYKNGGETTALIGFDAQIHIFPGDGTRPANVTAVGTTLNTRPQPFMAAWTLIKGINYKNRINAIRFSQYHSGDISNPVAGCVIAGIYRLSGAPNP